MESQVECNITITLTLGEARDIQKALEIVNQASMRSTGVVLYDNLHKVSKLDPFQKTLNASLKAFDK